MQLYQSHPYSPGGSILLYLVTLHLQTLFTAAAAAKSLQSCPTLCDPIDGSPPGSLVPGILQARTLEWVAISFSNAWRWKVKVKLLSGVWPSATPWTAAYQAPPSMGFSRQEYWSGVPLPSPLFTAVCRKIFDWIIRRWELEDIFKILPFMGQVITFLWSMYIKGPFERSRTNRNAERPAGLVEIHSRRQ